MNSLDEVLAAFERVERYRRGPDRAPHKPLVMLFALRELQRGRTSIRFIDTEAAIAPLLDRFWTPGGPHRVEQPFVRLASDGFWQLGFERADAETAGGSISVPWLRQHDATASFEPKTQAVLLADRRRIAWAASILLLDACQAEAPFEIAEALQLQL